MTWSLSSNEAVVAYLKLESVSLQEEPVEMRWCIAVVLLQFFSPALQADPLLYELQNGQEKPKPWLNPALEDVFPSRELSKPTQIREIQQTEMTSHSFPMFAEYTNLNKGNFCQYPYADKEYASSKFEVLVNVDHFEFIEWIEDSYGSVPQYAIKTCPNSDIYVGKNKYGLGKVVAQHEAFFLPWEGEEYWYKNYHVLAINTDSYSQHISHVEYGIDQMELFHHPPEALQMAKVTNLECRNVEKTVKLEKTSTVEKTWDIGRETRNGSISTMKAKVPILGPGTVDFTKEQTVTFSEGTSMSESISHSVSVELLVPPNHSCAVRMEGRKMTAEIPYTGRLSRTNHKGETHWTYITGTYDGVSVGEINAVVDRCQPVTDAVPCSPSQD
ncbi:Natterin-3 [Larimichthys crocea]|uniref:Natterin-3 n=1 Tax=Larimichthys crocea TaxID=215358 RepID=A0A6G0IKA3_LARCR|nr:Natterin-3 [Larimichthys crocea]